MSKLDGKIDEICEKLIAGETYRNIASDLDVPLSTLYDYTSKPEHSARVKTALEFSASTYADKAEQALLLAESDKNEIARARELAQHYRWHAGKRNPRTYGDKIDVTTKGEAITSFSVGFSKNEQESD
jgi:hypothetical protein